jgi:hypothetical protein
MFASLPNKLKNCKIETTVKPSVCGAASFLCSSGSVSGKEKLTGSFPLAYGVQQYNIQYLYFDAAALSAREIMRFLAAPTPALAPQLWSLL